MNVLEHGTGYSDNSIKVSSEYLIIKAFYGDRTARRSGVPLMNHIEEGISILRAFNAPDHVVGAFCLHPILQNKVDVSDMPKHSARLAETYSLFANHILPKHVTLGGPEDAPFINSYEKFADSMFRLQSQEGVMSVNCALMLYADKIQNQKDFYRYHYHSHPKREVLEFYFRCWIQFLKQNYDLLFYLKDMVSTHEERNPSQSREEA